MIPTLIGITFLTYVIIRSAPGDPLSATMQEGRGPQKGMLTSGDQGNYKKLLHLDKDPVTAYFFWVQDFFSEKNISSKYKRFVFDVILERLPNTIALNVYSLIIFYALGLSLGIDSAVRAGTIRERVITVLLFLMYSLPSFWVGLILIVYMGSGGMVRDSTGGWLPGGLASYQTLFVMALALFGAAFLIQKTRRQDACGTEKSNPLMWVVNGLRAAGWVSVALLIAGMIVFAALAFNNRFSITEFERMLLFREIPARLSGLPIARLEPDNTAPYTYLELLWASIPYYIMPVICMSYAGLASESRYLRVGLMGVLREDYVRTAKAKGLAGWQVIARHALPNALTPIVVQLAGLLPGLIGGSVIVETIFSVPGMGLLFFEAVQARDYNLIMAEAFIGAVLVLFGILVSDLLLAVLDPRVTFEKAAS